jgi:hypothetical protein
VSATNAIVDGVSDATFCSRGSRSVKFVA